MDLLRNLCTPSSHALSLLGPHLHFLCVVHVLRVLQLGRHKPTQSTSLHNSHGHYQIRVLARSSTSVQLKLHQTSRQACKTIFLAPAYSNATTILSYIIYWGTYHVVISRTYSSTVVSKQSLTVGFVSHPTYHALWNNTNLLQKTREYGNLKTSWADSCFNKIRKFNKIEFANLLLTNSLSLEISQLVSSNIDLPLALVSSNMKRQLTKLYPRNKTQGGPKKRVQWE